MSVGDRIARGLRDPETKRRYVRDLFGRIAGRYDLTNDVMSFGLHRRWKDRLLELAEPEPGHRVLDLAAGTGDLALGASGRMAEGASGRTGPVRSEPSRAASGVIVAADLTPEMMRVGRRRAGEEASERAGGAPITWVAADATRLPLPERSFDRVVIGYGLRNFPDLEASLREIHRCLRPGGRLVALDFGKPRSSWYRAAYLAYLEVSTRAVGWLLHRDVEAYAYIPASLRRFPGQRELTDLLGDLGYVRRGFVEFLGGAMAIVWGERKVED